MKRIVFSFSKPKNLQLPEYSFSQENLYGHLNMETRGGQLKLRPEYDLSQSEVVISPQETKAYRGVDKVTSITDQNSEWDFKLLQVREIIDDGNH